MIALRESEPSRSDSGSSKRRWTDFADARSSTGDSSGTASPSSGMRMGMRLHEPRPPVERLVVVLGALALAGLALLLVGWRTFGMIGSEPEVSAGGGSSGEVGP